MPAVTVPDNLTLPHIATPEPGAPVRTVNSITDAPSGFEGEGFPVRRAFAGASLADLDPFIHVWTPSSPGRAVAPTPLGRPPSNGVRPTTLL